MERVLLKVPEIAKQLRVTPSRVHQLISEGHIPVIRIGGTVRIPGDKWEAIVNGIAPRERGDL